MIESTRPIMNVDLSQGSHYFQNLSTFEAAYFMLRNDDDFHIDRQWLDNQPSIYETPPVPRVRLYEPRTIKVDGRIGHGMIQRTNR